MTHDRVEEAMHAVDCGCDGGCGYPRDFSGRYPYREMAAAALDALDLPARDRRVKAQALRAVADDWKMGGWAGAPRRADRVVERIANAQYVTDWLRRRADEIEAGP